MIPPVPISVRSPLSQLPAPHASSGKRHQLCAGGFAALARLSSPLSATEPSVALQSHGWVTGKRHPRADTCAAEVCRVPDTSGGWGLFPFQLLTHPDRSSCWVLCFGRANKILSLTVRFQAPLLLILLPSLCDTAPHQGNYRHWEAHIKFLINQCVVISFLPLMQPPLPLLCNRSSSGASSSFHSHLLISSDIFQGWFLYCFRDIFLASSFCLVLETEHTWEECQKCDIFADLFLPLFLPPLPVFSLDINNPEHELICVNGVIQCTF